MGLIFTLPIEKVLEASYNFVLISYQWSTPRSLGSIVHQTLTLTVNFSPISSTRTIHIHDSWAYTELSNSLHPSPIRYHIAVEPARPDIARCCDTGDAIQPDSRGKTQPRKARESFDRPGLYGTAKTSNPGSPY